MNFPYIDDDEDDGYSSVDSYDWSDGEQVGGAEAVGAEAVGAEAVGAEAESAEAEHTEVAKETYEQKEKRKLEEFLQDLNKYLEVPPTTPEGPTLKRIKEYIDKEKEDIRKVLKQAAVQNDTQDDAQDDAQDAPGIFDSFQIKDLENSKFHLVLKKVKCSGDEPFDIEKEIDTFMQEKLQGVVNDMKKEGLIPMFTINNRNSYMKFERNLDNELYSRIMDDIFVIHVVGLNDDDELKKFIDTVVKSIVNSVSSSENIHKILIKCWECKGSKKLDNIEGDTTCEFKYKLKPFPRTPMNSDKNRYIVLLFKDIFEDDSTYDKKINELVNFVNLDYNDKNNRPKLPTSIISFDETSKELKNNCTYLMRSAEGNAHLRCASEL